MVKSFSWLGTIGDCWEKSRNTEKVRWPVGFNEAACLDAGVTCRRIFAPLLTQLTSMALSEIANPMERLRHITSLSVDVSILPSTLSVATDPELAIKARLVPIIEHLFHGYSELAASLIQNEDTLGLVFSESGDAVVSIESLGDVHDNGSCVRRVRFSTGRLFIFKPRSGNAEASLATVCRGLKRSVESLSNVFPIPLVCSQTYSWWEPTEQLVKSLAPDGRDLGVLPEAYGYALGIAILFAYEDLHYENILFRATDGSTEIIDSETAWAARLPKDNASLGGMHPITWLAFKTGLIPSPRFRGREIADESPLIKLMIKPSLPDSKIWETRHGSSFFDTEQLWDLNPSWFDFLRHGIAKGVTGFRTDFIATFSKNKKTLEDAAKSRVRFVYRPTKNYYAILQSAIKDEVILGVDFNSRLWASLFEGSENDALRLDVHKRLCAYELEALRVGAIPFFELDNENNLILFGGESVTYWRTDQDYVGAHIMSMSDAKGWDELICMVDKVIRNYSNFFSGNTASLATVKNVDQQSFDVGVSSIEDASKVAEMISNKGLSLQHGQIEFVDFAPTGWNDEISILLTGKGLYRGSAGIGLALWSVARLGEKKCSNFDWRDCFSDINRSASRNHLADRGSEIGWSMADGIFGVMYAMAIIGTEISPSRALKRALDVAILDGAVSDKCHEWDFINGVAGMLCCYIAVSKRCGVAIYDAPAEKLFALVERLVEEKIFDTALLSPSPLKGIAHGLSGLLYALGVARQNWRSDGVHRLYERVYRHASISSGGTNSDDWPNAGTWCGGATGVIRGWSRINDSRLSNDRWLTSKSESGTGRVQQLCCGTFGQVLLSLESSKCDDKVERLQAIGKVWLANMRAPTFTSFDVVDRPIQCVGFFQGFAGILYYASHFARGEAAPCVEMAD